MPKRLIILEDPMPPREVVAEGETLEVGRAPEGAIVLGDRSVSRRHALIRRKNGDLVIEDAGSTLGTFVNEQPIRRGEHVTLEDGDVVRIGQVKVICRFDPESSIGEATSESVFASQANARLLVLEGEYVRRLPLAGPVTIIGCAAHCDVRLQDRNGPPELAVIRTVNGCFQLEPRCSSSPPKLNEGQIPVTKPVPLASNSVLLLQRAQALFLYDFDEEGQPIADPLRAIPRKTLLRQVAEQSGHSAKALQRLCRDRAALGQTLGEILVSQNLVTPLTWRVFSTRLLSRPRRRWFEFWKREDG